MEEGREREHKKVSAGGGQKAGGDRTGCASRATAGQQVRDVTLFNDFYPFFNKQTIDQKSRPKNIDDSLFLLELNFVVSHERHLVL